jgi:hypothetical protein
MQSETSTGIKRNADIPFIILSVIYFLLYAIFLIPFSKEIISYTIIYISSSALFIVISFFILKKRISKNILYYIITGSVVLRMCLMFIHPIGSDDFYRYLWEGKVISNGFNPYKFEPASPELSEIHSDILPEKVGFKDLKSVYPPLSLILFSLSYQIGGESFWGIKILLFLFEVITVLVIYLILKDLKIKLQNILLYMLCPLPLFQFFIDAHIDGFGLTLLILSIYFYLKKNRPLSLLFIALSICIKPVGIILLPVYFFLEKELKYKAEVLAVPAAVCFLLYLPFIFSANVFEALTTFTVNWTFNGFIFEIINYFLQNNQISRIICFCLLIIMVFPVYISKMNFLNKAYLSIILLLILSPVVHPWYVSWLVIFIPLLPKWSGILFVVLVSLTSFTVVNYQLNNIWKNFTLVLVIEYVPVILVLLYELYLSKMNHFKNKKFY